MGKKQEGNGGNEEEIKVLFGFVASGDEGEWE